MPVNYHKNPVSWIGPCWYHDTSTRPDGWYYTGISGAWHHGPYGTEMDAEEFGKTYETLCEDPKYLTPEKVRELLDQGIKDADAFTKRVRQWQSKCKADD